jgi:diaminopimelate epimerase
MIEFTKMQGLGNDFIIVDNRKYSLSNEQLSKLAARICTRKISLGADGLMAVASGEQSDFKMIFFNGDGSLGEMCGNGARCIVRYAYEKGVASREMTFETTAGVVRGVVEDKRLVTVGLNLPKVIRLDQNILVDGRTYLVDYIELGDPGVPHAMIAIEALDIHNPDYLKSLAKALRFHKSFHKGANINFYHKSYSYVQAVTYERGVEDFTMACGTGVASLAVVLSLKKESTSEPIKIQMPGGMLRITIHKQKDRIEKLELTGETSMVAEGIILDEDLNW